MINHLNHNKTKGKFKASIVEKHKIQVSRNCRNGLIIYQAKLLQQSIFYPITLTKYYLNTPMTREISSHQKSPQAMEMGSFIYQIHI